MKRDRSSYMKGYYIKNKAKILAYNNAYRKIYDILPKYRTVRRSRRFQKKDEIFKILGDKCVRCGFSDKRALQMDHKKGRNGEKRLGNVDNRFRYVRDNPDEAKAKYQILCANCNFIKKEENKEHYYHGLKPL